MSGVLHPVGPEPPAVYWRRRLLVGFAILVVLIIVVVMFWPGGGTDSRPLVPSPSPSSSESGSASPSPSGSPTSSPVGDECSDSAIQVTAESAKQTYPIGSTIEFAMLIANSSGETCNRNVGPRVNTFVVTSGGYHAWSSDDCNPGGGDQLVSIKPNEAYKVTARWSQNLTEEACPSGLGKAQAGTYSVVGKNGAATSPPITFFIS